MKSLTSRFYSDDVCGVNPCLKGAAVKERKEFAKVIESSKTPGEFLVIPTKGEHFAFVRFKCRPPANQKRNKINKAFESAVRERVRPLVEAAKKIKNWKDSGYLRHSIICNSQDDSCIRCNCGLEDIVSALEKFQQ